jgi:hypothetical protein
MNTVHRAVRAFVVAPLAVIVGAVIGPSSVLGIALFVVA